MAEGASSDRVELERLGLSPAQAAWALKKLRARALDLTREDPYKLSEEVPGIGFKTADRMASAAGLRHDSPGRLRAGVLHAMKERAEEGHACFPFHRLVQDAQALLEVDRRLVSGAIRDMAAQGALVLESLARDAERDPAVYLPYLAAAEASVSGNLLRLLGGNGPRHATDAQKIFEGVQDELSLKLAPAQAEALRSAVSRNLTVICGGPGTGKTTVLKALLGVCDKAGIRVLLAAPTGRAARRMKDATGRESKTIHRLLDYAPSAGGFRKNPSDPLECDLVVVDEASMVDTLLMHHLLRALPPGSGLVLVGDANQLPSVGPGQVLHDIIASGVAAVVELTEVFRQARESEIVANAHRVIQGLLPAEDANRENRDFFFVEEGNPGRAVERIVELVKERIPRKLSVDPIDGVQVIAPMHKGAAGSNSLNRALQKALNPAGVAFAPAGGLFASATGALMTGDKVMQTRNNYDKGVYNGDIGRITDVGARADGGSISVSFDGETVRYAEDEMDQLSLAYALSVHKSQGSEFPAVVLSLLDEHAAMLQRNLLYTAITRARRLAVIVGSRAALATAVKRSQAQGRFTGLVERLRAGT